MLQSWEGSRDHLTQPAYVTEKETEAQKSQVSGPAAPSGRAGAQMLLSWLPVQSAFLTSPHLPLNLSETILLSYNRQKSNEGNKMKKRKKEIETERKGWKR